MYLNLTRGGLQFSTGGQFARISGQFQVHHLLATRQTQTFSLEMEPILPPSAEIGTAFVLVTTQLNESLTNHSQIYRNTTHGLASQQMRTRAVRFFGPLT